ncbi:MAG: hypothetical protein ACRCV3_00635 [Desulfovibrionaceae bacterium]
MKKTDSSVQSIQEYLSKSREKLEKLKKTIKEQDRTLIAIKKDLESFGITFGHTIHIPTEIESLTFPKELSDTIAVMRDLIKSLPKDDEILPNKKGFLHHSRKLQML